MKNIAAKDSNLLATLMVSLLLHLAAFGAATTMQLQAQPVVIKEYIPVELVQLPSLPRSIVRASAAAAPRPAKIPTPAITTVRAEPTPAPVAPAPVFPQQQAKIEAPPAGSQMQPRSAAAPVGGTVGSVISPSPSGTGVAQPQSRGNGNYQAFYRLTRIPSFRSRAEPVYPDSERMTGSEARVLAEIYLDEHGVVDDVTIKKSGGRIFDKAVIDAARQSSFHPGYMGEKAVPTVIQIPYTFKLR